MGDDAARMKERALIVGGFGCVAAAVATLVLGSASAAILTFVFLALGAGLLLFGLVRMRKTEQMEKPEDPPRVPEAVTASSGSSPRSSPGSPSSLVLSRQRSRSARLSATRPPISLPDSRASRSTSGSPPSGTRNRGRAKRRYGAWRCSSWRSARSGRSSSPSAARAITPRTSSPGSLPSRRSTTSAPLRADRLARRPDRSRDHRRDPRRRPRASDQACVTALPQRVPALGPAAADSAATTMITDASRMIDDTATSSGSWLGTRSW